MSCPLASPSCNEDVRSRELNKMHAAISVRARVNKRRRTRVALNIWGTPHQRSATASRSKKRAAKHTQHSLQHAVDAKSEGCRATNPRRARLLRRRHRSSGSLDDFATTAHQVHYPAHPPEPLSRAICNVHNELRGRLGPDEVVRVDCGAVALRARGLFYLTLLPRLNRSVTWCCGGLYWSWSTLSWGRTHPLLSVAH